MNTGSAEQITARNMPPTQYEKTRAHLAAFGQSHLLKFWPELADAERAELLADIEQVAFEPLLKLIETHVRTRSCWAWKRLVSFESRASLRRHTLILGVRLNSAKTWVASSGR